jgi:hypothetical protein
MEDSDTLLCTDYRSRRGQTSQVGMNRRNAENEKKKTIFSAFSPSLRFQTVFETFWQAAS